MWICFKGKWEKCKYNSLYSSWSSYECCSLRKALQVVWKRILLLFSYTGRFLYYDDTCLEQPYLITSRKTGFAVDLLFEWSLSILHHSSSFTSMAESYIDFHLGNVEDLEISKETREALCEKRLSEGWFLYSLLEIKQRYVIEGWSNLSSCCKFLQQRIF